VELGTSYSGKLHIGTSKGRREIVEKRQRKEVNDSPGSSLEKVNISFSLTNWSKKFVIVAMNNCDYVNLVVHEITNLVMIMIPFTLKHPFSDFRITDNKALIQ
jgi:hypothetical protein